jgi:hypothetical protein
LTQEVRKRAAVTPAARTRRHHLHGVDVVQFLEWLKSQRERADAVGAYARVAVSNITYPRSSSLQVLLQHEPEVSREGLKRAHREWRQLRMRRGRVA